MPDGLDAGVRGAQSRRGKRDRLAGIVRELEGELLCWQLGGEVVRLTGPQIDQIRVAGGTAVRSQR